MDTIKSSFSKLYKALPFFGPVAYSIKKEYRYIYSKVFYCRTFKFNVLIRLLLLIISKLLWFIKALSSICKNLKTNSEKVKESYGISILKQIKELAYLAFIKSAPPDNYYYLELYKRNLNIGETYLINDHICPILGYLSSSDSRAAINNKLDFWLKLNKIIPSVVEPVALVTSEKITFFKNLESLPEFDLFVKPVAGFGGRDCFCIKYIGDSQYKVSGSKLIFDNPNLEKYLKCVAKDEQLMVQPLLKNHPEIEKLSNDNLSTCRITTFINFDNEIQILFAMFLMPVDDSITSNTNGIGCEINLETGTLSGAIALTNPFNRIYFHPQGGGKIIGTILPDWNNAIEICKKAHNEFRELPIIGWDIAFTPDCLAFLEANLVWDVEYWQLTNQFSFNPDGFISLLEKYMKMKVERNK